MPEIAGPKAFSASQTVRTGAGGPLGDAPSSQPVIQPAVVADSLSGQPLSPHKAADDTEQIYFEGSPMARAILGAGFLWCLLGMVIIAIPAAAYFLHRPNEYLHPLWLNFAIVFVGLVLFCFPILRAKTIRYRITNYRIDFERGWFSKDIDTLELWHVEDLKFHQSFVDRILGVGTIIVLSHDDTSPKLLLVGLPNPRPIFESLKQRIIAVKRQGGVVKMDTGT